MRAAWVVVLSGFAAASARADDLHVLPCRPTVSCTADLAPPGTLEIELGYQAVRDDATGNVTQSTPVLVKLPVAHWLELQLGDNGYTVAPNTYYLDNVIAGAKLHVADQTDHRPSLALTVAASVPTVAQEGYTRTTDLFVTAHASKDFGKLHVDANIGLDAWQLEGPAGPGAPGTQYQPFVVAAATYAVTDKLGIALEPHYFASAGAIAPRNFGLLAAVEYAARPWLVVDAAVERVFLDQGSIAALAGISLAPVRLWERR
jgi:hypothetical protein